MLILSIWPYRLIGCAIGFTNISASIIVASTTFGRTDS